MNTGKIYKSLIAPVLDRLDAETMHHFTGELLHLMAKSGPSRLLINYALAGGQRIVDPALKTVIGGIELENPTISSCWDKPGKSVRGLYELGFGGVEVGGVLEFAQPGNPKPRQFMIAPGVSLNALGFPGPGMEAVAANLKEFSGLNIPIGINIGKNQNVLEDAAPRAYAVVAKRLYAQTSYFTINVSSPNTVGLKKLQDKPQLLAIVSAVKEATLSQGAMKPIFVKVAPDLTYDGLDDVIDLVLSEKLSGIVTTNTFNNADLKAKYGEKWRNQPGGLSGDDAEYRAIGTQQVAHIYRTTKGSVDIMGVGGVKDGKTALEKIQAGAKAVQIMTALRGEGPGVVRTICLELLEEMKKLGVKSISELVGTNAENVKTDQGKRAAI